MKELAAINKMLDAIFAYGPSQEKKKKKGIRAKKPKAKRKSNT